MPVDRAAPGFSPTMAAPEERRDRRRLGNMLSAYYGIEGSQSARQANGSAAQPAPQVVAPMDRDDFDAKGHFDATVAKGYVADVLKSANELDAEVKDLDGDMQ